MFQHAMFDYPMVNPIKSHETTIFLWFSNGFPLKSPCYDGDVPLNHPKNHPSLAAPRHGRDDGFGGSISPGEAQKLPGFHHEDKGCTLAMTISIDWFKGKIAGKSHISWENLWFSVDFPLSQPIDIQILEKHIIRSPEWLGHKRG